MRKNYREHKGDFTEKSYRSGYINGMKKIIPFLFVLFAALCVFVTKNYLTEMSSGQTDAPSSLDMSDSERFDAGEVLSGVEDVLIGDAARASTSTRMSGGQVSAHGEGGLRDVYGTTTMSPSSSITELVKVQPGFGGGAAAKQPSLVQLPEYKEEREKVEPKIEFEYCD